MTSCSEAPGLLCGGVSAETVIFHDEDHSQVPAYCEVESVAIGPNAGAHVSYEAPDSVPGGSYPTGNREGATHDAGGVEVVLWAADEHAPARKDLAPHFCAGDSFEECVVVATPSAEDPVLWANFLEDLEELILVPSTKVNWSVDLPLGKEITNISFKLDEVFST